MSPKDIDYESSRLNELMWDYRAARVLHAANSIGIFSELCGKSLNLEQICSLCRTKSEMTEKLLIACAAMGLLEKTDECYKNTDFSQKYLVPGSSLYQGDIIAHASNVWDYWSNLENEVRVKPRPIDEEERHRHFIMGMANITALGRGKLFLDHIDLRGRKKLLDVGGGPGMYSILACRKYPELKAIVFDLPETIAIAKKLIEKEQMQDRISIVEASWDSSDFGSGNDVVLLSNVLHGPNSNAENKLSKAFNSMTSDGLLVIQEFVLNNDKTGPEIPALFNVMIGAYSENELRSVIAESGFGRIEVVMNCKEIGSTWLTAVKP